MLTVHLPRYLQLRASRTGAASVSTPSISPVSTHRHEAQRQTLDVVRQFQSILTSDIVAWQEFSEASAAAFGCGSGERSPKRTWPDLTMTPWGVNSGLYVTIRAFSRCDRRGRGLVIYLILRDQKSNAFGIKLICQATSL